MMPSNFRIYSHNAASPILGDQNKITFDDRLLNDRYLSIINHENTISCTTGVDIISLDIRQLPDISDLEIRAIAARCPHLRELFFKSKNVTDEGVSALARLKSLKTLSVGYNLEYLTPDSDKYAEGLRKINCLQLTTLDLSDCHYLSPNTFSYLCGFKNLEILRFPKMSKVQLFALEELESSLPHTNILFGGLSPHRITLYEPSLDY